mgnify:CR=1
RIVAGIDAWFWRSLNAVVIILGRLSQIGQFDSFGPTAKTLSKDFGELPRPPHS